MRVLIFTGCRLDKASSYDEVSKSLSIIQNLQNVVCDKEIPEVFSSMTLEKLSTAFKKSHTRKAGMFATLISFDSHHDV